MSPLSHSQFLNVLYGQSAHSFLRDSLLRELRDEIDDDEEEEEGLVDDELDSVDGLGNGVDGELKSSKELGTSEEGRESGSPKELDSVDGCKLLDELLEDEELLGELSGLDEIEADELLGELSGPDDIDDGDALLLGELSGLDKIEDDELLGDISGLDEIEDEELLGELSGLDKIEDGELLCELSGLDEIEDGDALLLDELSELDGDGKLLNGVDSASLEESNDEDGDGVGDISGSDEKLLNGVVDGASLDSNNEDGSTKVDDGLSLVEGDDSLGIDDAEELEGSSDEPMKSDEENSLEILGLDGNSDD